MATEIERKFLVDNDQWRAQVVTESRLKQGYLANQMNASIRVRIGKGKAHLNIKSATIGASRSEFEYEVPMEDAEAMLAEVAQQPFIDKTRYKVKCGDHIWDLDVFEGDNLGLVVAEVELKDEGESFEMPLWAGEEVTGDPKYYNVSLITKPYKDW
ncbi:MAG: CYTH domain-containing protein [Gammaproteobacteria bacterium]|nr:CYTH domain-containing protein [Gammaproteobacteria bacterium]